MPGRDMNIASNSRCRGVVVECLRQLHPVCQWESGVAFFQYLAALTVSAAATGLWILRRPGALEGLVLAAILWLCVLGGSWLMVVLDAQSVTDDLRRDLEQVRERDQRPSVGVTRPDQQAGRTRSATAPLRADGRKDHPYGPTVTSN